MDRVLGDIARHARDQAGKLCLVEGDLALTFAELADLTDQLADAITKQIGEPGKCIGWFGGEGARRLLVQIALDKAGLTFCAPSIAFDDHQVKSVFAIAECKLILSEPAYEERALSLKTAPVILPDFEKVNANLAQGFKPASVDPKAASFSAFTSGSTGMPKVIDRSREALEFSST